ncbi:MAG TPA: homoserine dehydrogenase [Candidatus Caccovicinus merdipullorum]|uniref:Homoserine dehydrogenase n=1 Tax=Candidatus Caccovicinus merdipullorum TaxID=2840724 RepID=A0A9D1KG33_9FIRM|nr:homoserine dehydrogenase [Candidatus Caccovicinus merdipullorum]
MINVAIMGYGTIGSGVAEILETNKEIIAKNVGQEVALKYVLDLRDFPGSPVEDKVVHDFSIIEKDPEVQIVVETMGGLNPSYPFVKACLLAGKHVATSNKALVAAYGTELLQIAREKEVNFFFEASVGGGIPIIRPLYRCLMGEKILNITGILNGTTNFILTKMDKEGWAFDAALKEAQRLGYAERNPEADVEGHDTCRKIAILTAMATGKEVNYEDIYTEGITGISDVDFRYADKMGMSVKLFGSSSMGEDNLVKAYVAPIMIDRNHPLYMVSDVYNGIMVTGNMLGETMYYGSGAGKLPTASAVAADIIDAAKHVNRNVPMGWNSERQAIAPMEANEFRYFIRMAGQPEERLGSLMELDPEEAVTLEGMDEFAVVTRPMLEADFKELTAGLDGLIKFIRVEQ